MYFRFHIADRMNSDVGRTGGPVERDIEQVTYDLLSANWCFIVVVSEYLPLPIYSSV